MCSAPIHRSRDRILEILLATISLAAFVAFARTAWMETGGSWISRHKLLHAFASLVPEWNSWNRDGARTTEFTANPLAAWLFCSAYSAAIWMAGCRGDKILRPLWLLVSLLGTFAFIGAGERGSAIVVTGSVTLAWNILRFTAHEGRRTISSMPSLKPVWTAAGLGLLVYFVTDAIWQTSFANPGVSLPAWLAGYTVATVVGLAITAFIIKGTRNHPVLCGALISATLSASWYTGPGATGFLQAWRWRQSEFIRLTESHGWRELHQGLAESRLSEAEASVQRLHRPEVKTDWPRRHELMKHAEILGNEGRIVAAWLAADEALYAGKTGAEHDSSRTAALSRVEALPDSAVTSEIKGWLRLDAGENTAARDAFQRALELNPAAPMRWLGLGLTEATAGNDADASKALVRWCMLDPRAVFSPAWERPPLNKLHLETLRRWMEAAAESITSGELSSEEVARLQRFMGWQSAWEKAGGDVGKFLADSAAPSPLAGAVVGVRARLQETLNSPKKEKIGACLSAGTMLLADRHVNIRQCDEIFGAIIAKKTGVTEASIRISRPPTPTLPGSDRMTEVGTGATLHDFEENLVIRLITYGQESAPIRIPDKFLRQGLAR